MKVDSDSGKVKALDVDTADNCGKTVNVLYSEGSSEGGIRRVSS